MEISTLVLNPKYNLGLQKVPGTCLPPAVANYIAVGMYEGDRKHGGYNFRAVGNIDARTYVDAARRHLDLFTEGEDFDPDSKANLHHVGKAISSLTVLLDAVLRGVMEDNRPPAMPKGWMDDLNAKVKLLNEAYPERAHTYTEAERAVPEVTCAPCAA